VARPIADVKNAVEGPVVRNAASLYGTTIVTSILGFVYWFVAARMASAQAVGTASAVQSAAQFLSIFCLLGLNTLLISELSSDRRKARTLMITAAVGVGIASLVISAGVGIGLMRLSSGIREGLNGPAGIIVFALLCALSTVLLVLDDACIGLLRGDLQLMRNAVFAVTKLALLPILIVIWASPSGLELVVAWLAGLIVSLVTLGFRLAKLTAGQASRLAFKSLFAMRRLMAGHHWLNLSIRAPTLILPVLVAVIVGPKANAAFTAAFLVVSFVNIIPSLLSTVLFALAPGDEATLRREVRKTMKLCLPVALVSAPFFIIFSGQILRIFGPHYVTATAALAILGLTTYPAVIKAHYVAIARVRGQMQQAAFRTMVGACLEVGFAAAGATIYGLTGLALGFLVATTTEAVIFSRTVFGVLRGRHVVRRHQGEYGKGMASRKRNLPMSFDILTPKEDDPAITGIMVDPRSSGTLFLPGRYSEESPPDPYHYEVIATSDKGVEVDDEKIETSDGYMVRLRVQNRRRRPTIVKLYWTMND
jgi:O-antigen/teichoic acid export membrane protein